MASEAISEHLFSGRACPIVLHTCMLMHAYIHIRHPYTHSTNSGHGSVTLIAEFRVYCFRSWGIKTYNLTASLISPVMLFIPFTQGCLLQQVVRSYFH